MEKLFGGDTFVGFIRTRFIWSVWSARALYKSQRFQLKGIIQTDRLGNRYNNNPPGSHCMPAETFLCVWFTYFVGFFVVSFHL